MENGYLRRGKRIDNGEWAEGCLIVDEKDYSKYFIGYVFGTNKDGTPHDLDAVQVDPSTICQCTGIKDKNGKLIWKNDIVRHYNDEEHPESYWIGVVLWDDNYAGFYRTDNKYRDEKPRISNRCRYEVIGNTFDNPELLEV